MARKRAKAKGRADYVPGGYLKITRRMLDHKNFISLSRSAKLTYQFIKGQYNGYNNGNLAAALSMYKAKGYGTSSSQLRKSLVELEDKEFILKTRQGGKNRCNLFAVTDEAIDDCNGKHDYRATKVASNCWMKGGN